MEKKYSIRDFVYYLEKYEEQPNTEKFTKEQIATNIAKAMLNFFEDTSTSY